ncbi:MAG: folate-binding protein [Pacificimonas sp.]
MLVHLADRKVLRLHGDDLAAFLNGIVTNDVGKVAENAPAWAGLLSAQGKYIVDMTIFAGGADELLLDMPAARFDEAYGALKRYRLRRPIDMSESRQQVFAGWDDKMLVKPGDPRSAALGKRWLGATESVTGDLADYHAHRIATGVPDSADFLALGEGKLMWLESGADLLNGVDFTKGCFVGQENTARMNYRAKVKKRILPVALSGDPGDGQDIFADGKAAGTLTSLASVDGSCLGMAHLRMEMADRDLSLDGKTVSVRWPDWLSGETGGND